MPRPPEVETVALQELLPRVAEEASVLLARSFPLPRLQHSAALLSWHAEVAAAHLDIVGATARVDGRLVGFVGLSLREGQLGDDRHKVAIVSFVSTHPDFRHRGISAQLYDLILPVLRERALPVLEYRLADGAGSRHNPRHYERQGFSSHLVATLPSFGAMATRVMKATTGPPLELLVSTTCLMPTPSDALMAHLKRDPRGCALIGGSAAGRARVTRATVETEGGSNAYLLLEDLSPTAEGFLSVDTLAKEAISAFPDHGKMVIATAFPRVLEGRSRSLFRRMPGPAWEAWLQWRPSLAIPRLPDHTLLSVV